MAKPNAKETVEDANEGVIYLIRLGKGGVGKAWLRPGCIPLQTGKDVRCIDGDSNPQTPHAGTMSPRCSPLVP